MLPWSFSEEAAAEKQRHTWIYVRFLELAHFDNPALRIARLICIHSHSHPIRLANG